MTFYLICIFFIVSSFSQTNNTIPDSIKMQSSHDIIELNDLSCKQKVDKIKDIDILYNKVIIYFPDYGLETRNIISINTDSIAVELMNSWWWNNPKTKHSVYYNMAPIQSHVHQIGSKNKIKISTKDIIAIQPITDKNFLIKLVPGVVIGIIVLRVILLAINDQSHK